MNEKQVETLKILFAELKNSQEEMKKESQIALIAYLDGALSGIEGTQLKA